MGFLFIGMGEGVNNKLLSLIDFLFNGLIPSFDYWIQERIWIGGLIIYLTSLFMMKYIYNIPQIINGKEKI